MRPRHLIAAAAVVVAALAGAQLPATPASAADETVAKVEFVWSGINGAGVRTSDAIMSRSVRARFGFLKWAWSKDAKVVARLQRKVGVDGAWRNTAQTTSTTSNVFDFRIPPYSSDPAAARRVTVYYRLKVASGGSVKDGDTSPSIRIGYQNWHRYSGLKRALYVAEHLYCPDLAIRWVRDKPYAGQTGFGQYEARINVNVAAYPSAYRNSVIVHECAHHLQWKNYGSSGAGLTKMTHQARVIFGTNHPNPVEHMADCVARVAVPHGYLGYGGRCTAKQLRYAARILDGKRLY
jgi:hypothetical protein